MNAPQASPALNMERTPVIPAKESESGWLATEFHKRESAIENTKLNSFHLSLSLIPKLYPKQGSLEKRVSLKC